MKSYDEFNEFNEMNEGVQQRKNILLKQLDDHIKRKEEMHLQLDKGTYDELFKQAEKSNWKGGFVVEKDPKNSLNNILKYKVL